jgi:MinD-like ATPase involved in chromosome partitioning or flagellar assembly
VNVAGRLASLHKKVLVIEADIHSGVLSTLLNVSNDRSILHALASASDLTDMTWPHYIVHVFGFDLLLADPSKTRPLPSWVDYHQLLQFVLPRYDHIVVDLPEVVNSATEELVRSATNVLVVCTPEVLSLTLAGKRLEKLKHIPAERIQVVVNRWQAADMSVAALEEILKRKVSTVLPNDYKAVNSAVRTGTLIPSACELGQSISRYAKHLIGIVEPEPVAEPAPKLVSWFKR